MMMNRLFRPLLCLRPLLFTNSLGKFPSVFLKKFSSQSEIKIITPEDILHLQNPFAQFAASKFNIPPAKIAHMFKLYPALKNLKTLEKVEQFVCTLKSFGCKPDQIAKIMIHLPRCIMSSVENVLQPKLQLLRESGIEEVNMGGVLTIVYSVLTISLEHELLPRITLLKTTFQSHDLFIKAVLRHPRLLTITRENLVKCVAFWEGCGISGTDLAKLLCRNPYHLRVSSLMPAQADLIQTIGVDKGSKMYKYVLSVVVTHRIETLESKMHNLHLCGLSTEEIMELFRVCPHIFTFSTEKVRQTMQFLINDMELPANSVLRYPLLLKKNFETVIKPRLLVLQAIKSMNGLGLFDSKQRLSTILSMPEVRFLCKIVKESPEHMALHEVYEKAIANVSSGKKISTKAY